MNAKTTHYEGYICNSQHAFYAQNKRTMSRLYQSVLMFHFRNHKMMLEFRQESERKWNFVQYQSGLLLDVKLRLNDIKSK